MHVKSFEKCKIFYKNELRLANVISLFIMKILMNKVLIIYVWNCYYKMEKEVTCIYIWCASIWLDYSNDGFHNLA